MKVSSLWPSITTWKILIPLVAAGGRTQPSDHGGTINRVNEHCNKVVLNAERNMCLSSGVFHSLCNPAELQKVQQ
jgi:hypothetical protein